APHDEGVVKVGIFGDLLSSTCMRKRRGQLHVQREPKRARATDVLRLAVECALRVQRWCTNLRALAILAPQQNITIAQRIGPVAVREMGTRGGPRTRIG